MNTECTTYREALHVSFDAGEVIAANLAIHAEQCAACAAYRDELAALDAAFLAIPLEVPRNALAQRVKARLAAEPAHANDARWWLPSAAVLACTIAVCAAWYFAVPVDPWTWWEYANQTGPTPEWLVRETPLDAEFAAMQLYWNGFSGYLGSFSSSLMWTVVATGALIVAGLNGAEAYRLRVATNQTAHQRRWR